MPKIMPITVLRNTYEISDTCRKLEEPVFITKNGYGDMVIFRRNFPIIYNSHEKINRES